MKVPGTGTSPLTTTLAQLPVMTNVVGSVGDDSVAVDFDPVDGAVDYRIYPLPNDSAISQTATSLSIHNAIYRCAGTRQTYDAPNNLDSNWTTTSPDQNWPVFSASAPNAIDADYAAVVQVSSNSADDVLGYVFVEPATGLVPVYAVATTPISFEEGWRASRPKIYTTDATRQANLLAAGGRDDGIVFYVPATADATTQPVYGSAVGAASVDQVTCGNGYQYYYGSAKHSAHGGDPAPAVAFPVLISQAAGSVPLMSVEYLYNGGTCHTELAAGMSRYHLAAYQGRSPLTHVEWSGLTQNTTLVVEALGSGCPFQGLLAAQSLPPISDGGASYPNGATGPVIHQQFFMLSELQAKSAATGEVFVNGQYDTTTFPQPIARSYLTVTPVPQASAWDWFEGFSSFDTMTDVPTASCPTDQGCFHGRNSVFDLFAFSLDFGNDPHGNNRSVLTYGEVLSQFWLAFDDDGQDITSTVRMTALQTATMAADPDVYVHVTLSTDIVTTGRRYPQLILSDLDINASNYQPVLVGNIVPAINPNNTLIFQPIATGYGTEATISIQPFHAETGGGGAPWAVNNQYPADHLTVGDDPAPTPYEPVIEHTGLDRLTTFDVFLSGASPGAAKQGACGSSNGCLYVFMDGTPVACRQWISSVQFSGPVTVTFGDTLYHEGGDEDISNYPSPAEFLYNHQATETKRHIDNFGFKSGVSAPTWDQVRFPCPAVKLDQSDG